MRLTFGYASRVTRFGKADATRTQSVAYGLSFRACAISFAAPKAIAFTTLAQLCAFFHCSPNDLLIVDWEGEEIEKASQIMKQEFTRPEAMQLGFADEIWDTF